MFQLRAVPDILITTLKIHNGPEGVDSILRKACSAHIHYLNNLYTQLLVLEGGYLSILQIKPLLTLNAVRLSFVYLKI